MTAGGTVRKRWGGTREGRPWLIGLVAAAAVVVGAGGWLLARGQEVVARVNGDAITRDELYQAMVGQVGPQVLDELITERLIDQAAAEAGVAVTADEVEAEMEVIRAQFETAEEFQQALVQAGLTLEGLEAEVKRHLELRVLLDGEAAAGPEETRAFFEENKEALASKEAARLRHIVVNDRKLAEDLAERLQAGEPFEELARQHSLDKGAGERGGDLGYVARGELPPALEEVAFGLEEGQLSPVVEAGGAFHLLRLEGRRPAREAVFEELEEQIRRRLMDQRVLERYPDWLQGLRSQGRIETYLESP